MDSRHLSAVSIKIRNDGEKNAEVYRDEGVKLTYGKEEYIWKIED